MLLYQGIDNILTMVQNISHRFYGGDDTLHHLIIDADFQAKLRHVRGETALLAPNDSLANRARDRRVDIILLTPLHMR